MKGSQTCVSPLTSVPVVHEASDVADVLAVDQPDFRVWGFGLRVGGFRVRVSGPGFGFKRLGFRVSGLNHAWFWSFRSKM